MWTWTKAGFFLFSWIWNTDSERATMWVIHMCKQEKKLTKEPPHQECLAFSNPFPNALFPQKLSLFWFQQWTFPLFPNHLCLLLTCALLLILSRSSECVSHLRMGVLWDGISWSSLFKKVGVVRDGGILFMRKYGIEVLRICLLLQFLEETLFNCWFSVNVSIKLQVDLLLAHKFLGWIFKKSLIFLAKNTSRVTLSWSRFWDNGSESVLCLIVFHNFTLKKINFISWLLEIKTKGWHLICWSTRSHFTIPVK